MKFCDKLSKKRRDNNMSQEQLADRLGVSRQAVSKWESGSSVPDMEKIMQLCKILNCGIDDLVDDGLCKSSVREDNSNKNNGGKYVKEVLDFITKTINMFWSMRFIERIKCIVEMIVLIIVMFVIWSLGGIVVEEIFNGVIYLLPSRIYNMIRELFSIIYKIFGLGSGVVIFIHMFKIRYLDYFVTIEDKNTVDKSIEIPVEESNNNHEEKRQFIEHKKNKIVIRDSEHSIYSFFNMLGNIVLWFIKLFLIFIAFLGIISFVGIVFTTTYVVSLVGKGIIFLGMFITLIGVLLVNYIVLRLIFNFVFNQSNNYKRVFWIFIIGFIISGIGMGITFLEYTTFKEEDNQIIYKNYEQVINYEDKIVLSFLEDGNLEVIYEDRDDIKISIDYYDTGKVEITKSNYYESDNTGLVYYINYYEYGDGLIDNLNYVVDRFSKKERLLLNRDGNCMKIKLYVSKDIYNKLNNSYNNLYN